MATFWIDIDTNPPSLGSAGADLVVRAVVSGKLGGDDSPEIFVVVAESTTTQGPPQVFVGFQKSLTSAAPTVLGFEQWKARGEYNTMNLRFDATDHFPAGTVSISPAGKSGNSFFDNGKKKFPLEVRYNP